MTAQTVNYDKPVKNLIDALSATGHVTHTKYTKKSVTLHHNGGRLSHEGVLDVWKTRPASAHFDVDAYGRVAQYVDVHEYAWAVANTQGNKESISVELCNLTLEPHWEVAEPTWQEGVRLAGWLFVHEVEGAPRPSSNNLFYHHHWYSTSCAGPFMDQIYPKVLAAAQAAYDHFKGQPATKPVTPPKTQVQKLQELVHVVGDNKWGKDTDARVLLMRNASRTHVGYPHNSPAPFDTPTAQRILNVVADGSWGPRTQAALVLWVHAVQQILGVQADGSWGPATDNALLSLRAKYFNKF